MHKITKEITLKDPSNRKQSLNVLLDHWLNTENSDKPEIINELIEFLNEKGSTIPLYKLLELESHCCQKPEFAPVNNIKSIIITRIAELNEFIQNTLPECIEITEESYFKWFEALPVNKCHQIIINSPINNLARITKDVPPNLLISETMAESLNSMIYYHFKPWLNNVTKNEVLTDSIFESVQLGIVNHLFTFNTKYGFQPYIKRILFNKFIDYCRNESKQNGYEQDSKSKDVNQSFITLSLLLFIRLNFKPHHKLIFWHEHMNYVRKSLRVIEHDIFISEHGLLNIGVLWEEVIKEIVLIFKEIVNKSDYSDDHSTREYSKRLSDMFKPFAEILEDFFINVYPEKEYTALRKEYPQEQLKNMLLIYFFKDSKGDLRDKKKNRKLLSNWNTRIKKELFRVFKN